MTDDPDTERSGGRGLRARVLRAETSLAVLAVLAILYTAFLAQNLVAPIVAAVVASFIFMPLMRAIPFRFLPDAASAAIIVALIVGALGGATWALAEPAAKWAGRIPAALEELQRRSSDDLEAADGGDAQRPRNRWRKSPMSGPEPQSRGDEGARADRAGDGGGPARRAPRS